MSNCHIKSFETVAAYKTGYSTVDKPSVVKITTNNGIIYADANGKGRSSFDDNIEFVDLGLPSGTLWMKYNIGASHETDFGFYFQWASPTRYYDASTHTFDWSTTPYHTGSDYSTGWTKYNTQSSYGTVDNKTELEVDDDPAYVFTSGKCKSPTSTQINEILNSSYCTNEWTTINGVAGRKFTSTTNGNYIFFPAAGLCYGSSVYDVGSDVNVWSRSLCSDDPYNAWYLYCNSSGAGLNYYYYRYLGFSVRGVI